MSAEAPLALVTNPDHAHGPRIRRGLEALGYQILPPPTRAEQVSKHLEKRGARLALLVTLPGDERTLEEPSQIEDERGAEAHAEALVSMMNANAHAPIALTEHLLPHMAEDARVIHIAPPSEAGPGARMSTRTLRARSLVLQKAQSAVDIAVVDAEPVVETALELADTSATSPSSD